jgi:pentatricopeptide repeat protein
MTQFLRQAERIIEIMVGNGLQPDARVFHLLARTYLAVGDHANAIATLQRMDAAGIAPPMVTYHAMMKSFASANDPEAAYDMVRRIQVRSVSVSAALVAFVPAIGARLHPSL